MLATDLHKRRDDYATVLPPCPNCGRPMCLTRTDPRAGYADLCVFKCGECGVWLSESADERRPV